LAANVPYCVSMCLTGSHSWSVRSSRLGCRCVHEDVPGA
jgi:hypothetical protein